MKKTQGQRRQKWVYGVVALTFLLTSALGVFIYQKMAQSSYAWVATHAEAQGVVVDLVAEEEQYRNRKGRTRTRTVHSVHYEVEIDDGSYESSYEVSGGRFANLSIGDSLNIWYDPNDPYEQAPEEEVSGGQASSSSTAMMTVLPFTFGFAWFLKALLGFLFVRESASKLNEGFYSDNSWLDIEDNKLVLLDKEKVSLANFGKSQKKQVTSAFQSEASHAELAALLKSKQLNSVLLSDITSISSRHDEDTISVEAGEESLSLDFLNNGTKAHALARLEVALPATLQHTETQRTRLRSAMPRLVVLGVLGAAGVALGDPALWFVLGAIAVLFVAPKLIKRLINPTVLTEYNRVVEADQVPTETPVSKAA